MNFAADVIEEIALEGLDGITFNALWVRLEARQNFCLKLDCQSKEFIWKTVGLNQNIKFYVLPEPREDLLPYDRFAFKDPATGIWVHNVAEQNIYPLNIVEEEGVQGSCYCYKTRKDVTEQVRKDGQLQLNMSKILEQWGQKFVMVANQKARYDVLVRERDPNIELTNMMYCVLERVGRMRFSGETSHALSKVFFINIPSQIYYLCKKLQEFGYVTKQQFLTQVENHKNLNVRLIHLKHFYTPVQNKYAQLMERVSLYLEEKPKNTEVYNIFKADMGFMKKSFKCLLTSYPKHIKTCIKKYTEVRPTAPPKEYLCKTGNDKEKQLRVIQLIQPFRASIDDNEESDNSDSEDEDHGITPMEWQYGKTMLQQCLTGLESGGSKGLSQSQFATVMGFTRLEARSVLRKLSRLELCHSYKMDCGRQRKNIFVASGLFHNSEMLKEYKAEQSALQKNMTKHIEVNDSVNESQSEETINSDTPVEDRSKLDNSVLDEVQKRRLRWLINPYEKNTSSRLLKRTNWILESVQECRVIENEFHILKQIWQREQALGITEKMDKRSLKRILHWLQQEGRIQLLKSVIYKEGQAIELTIICLPEITSNDPAVKLAIEQAKLRLIGVRKENMEVQKKDHKDEPKASTSKTPTIHTIPSVTESIQRFQEYRNRFKTNTPMKYDVQSWRRYGLVPKFKRYQLVHEMLFYLLYNYQGLVPEIEEDTANQHSIDFTWTLDTPYNRPSESLDESTIDEMLAGMKEPPVYFDDLSWKRYLAPVPKHVGIPDISEGWCLISDILILLPLTVVCQIVNIPYKIDGLEKLLSDPKRRLYPITYLPYHITNQLLYARRYVYSFYECCLHLSKMGLLTFGPQIRKAKEKAFINLHQRAVLHDTRKTPPGYMRTVLPEDMTEFPVRIFNFETSTDVESYWCDMLMIVLDTNLNCKGVGRKDDVGESSDVVMSLEEASRIKEFKDIPSEPFIPGDQLGAGGFDSSLFCHLMRNWFRISDIKKVTSETNEDCEDVDPKLLQFSKVAEKISQKKITPPKKPSSAKPVSCKSGKQLGNKGGRGVKRLTKRKRVVEKIKSPKKKIRKTYYDAADFKALGMMTKERVIWSSKEDGIMLLCKVASYLMGGIRKGLLVPWTVVRDILHEKSKETSYDKSSKACQRRVAFALKNPVSKMNVGLFLSQAKQDKEIVKKYAYKKFNQFDPNVIALFKELVSVLIEKFKNQDDADKQPFPISVEELNTKYDLTKITTVDYWKERSDTDIQSDKDICFNVLYDLIHSFVVASKDKQGRSHEMYRIFNQYPDFLLTEVFARMKDDGIITKIKKVVKPLILGVNHHQLAQRYKFRFLNRFPDNMFSECHEFLERLWQKYVETDGATGIDVKYIEGGGTCASILSLMCLEKIQMKIKMPKEILVLDRTGGQLPISRGRIQKSLNEDALVDDDDDDDDDDEDDDLLDDAVKKKRKKGMELKAKEKEQHLVQHIIEIVQAEEGTSVSDNESRDPTSPRKKSKSPAKTKSQNVEIGESSKSGTEEYTATEDILNQENTNFSPTEIEFEFRRKMDVPEAGALPKSLSRALLALARNQSFQKIPNKNFNVQDNILIKTCDLEAFLMPTAKCHHSEAPSTPAGGNTDISSLFLSPEKFREILKMQQKLYPFELDMEELWTTFTENVGSDNLKDLKTIFEFVHKCGVLGIPKFDLLESLHEIENIKDKLQVLMDANAILPVGVHCRRYIAFQHARPWLVHSYRNTKGRTCSRSTVNRNQESDHIKLQDDSQLQDNKDQIQKLLNLGPKDTDTSTLEIPETPLVIIPDVVSLSESAFASTELPLSEVASTSTEQPPDNAQTELRVSKRPLDDPQPELRVSKRRRTTRVPEEVSTGPPPISTYEKIRLICRPWRKPEGHLNRCVFSSMLECVLLFIMANPSCYRKALEDKFGPYLNAVAVLQLLEVLEDLDCINKSIYRQTSSKTSLFSKPSVYEKGPRTRQVEVEERYDKVTYESTPDCCLKFGQFAFFLSALN